MERIINYLEVCWNFLKTISFGDVIDIIVIAIIIYNVLIFVRRTSTANVIKGIMLLIAVMFLSSVLNLNVVSYLLGGVFEFGILAIVVLFQPEIRKFLEQFGKDSGKFKWLWGGKPDDLSELDYAITQTVMACTEMSKTRTGVLIVFEREIDLDSYIKTGTIIDAEPASELIKNIFYPNTPLHDGAMIIRGGRIASAACMLPLSSNTNLSRDLGMRHRAGIGISERSDAVVAIVSEENGSISVAVDGMLKRHLAPDTFDKLLRNELMPKTEEKKRSILSKIISKTQEGGKE